MNLDLFLHFARLRVRERMEYRGAYFLGVAAQVLGWGAEYAVIWLLMHRFHTIHGWTWPQVALLFSLDLFSYALGASFAFSPMVELEPMVADGSFDTVLVRPLDPLLHLSARKYNVGYLAHVLISGGFLIWALTHLGLHLGPGRAAFLVLAIAGAACMQAAFLVALGAIAFGAVRSGFAFGLYFTIKGFISYPLSVYGVGVQWLLTLVVPLAFLNFYPAAWLVGGGGAVLPPVAGWLTPLLGPVLLYLAYRLFAAGVARYQGAGG